MEDMASFWCYLESIEELENKLIRSTFELESARMAAKVEMIKNQEKMKQLIQVLKKVRQERDEARDHLQKLLKELPPSSPPPIPPIETIIPPLQPHLPTEILIPPKKLTNVDTSSSTKSKTLTDKVSSEASMIDHLVKGKPLPCKGRLLQAVIEAGPLLETLIVAGPVPQWRNPPPQRRLMLPSNQSPKSENDFVVNSRSGAITAGSSLGLNNVVRESAGLSLKSGHSNTNGTDDSDFSHNPIQKGRQKRLCYRRVDGIIR